MGVAYFRTTDCLHWGISRTATNGDSFDASLTGHTVLQSQQSFRRYARFEKRSPNVLSIEQDSPVKHVDATRIAPNGCTYNSVKIEHAEAHIPSVRMTMFSTGNG